MLLIECGMVHKCLDIVCVVFVICWIPWYGIGWKLFLWFVGSHVAVSRVGWLHFSWRSHGLMVFVSASAVHMRQVCDGRWKAWHNG